MGQTKRQHYVPRSYLKRFSFDGKLLHTYFIHPDTPTVLTENELGKIWRNVSISDVCLKKDYHTVRQHTEGNDINPMALEKDFFQDYAEPKFQSIIDTLDALAQKFIKNGDRIASFNITSEQKLRLIQSIFIQYHMSPRLRHPFEEINNFIKHWEISNGKESLGMDVASTHADKTYINLFLFRAFAAKLLGYSMLFRVSNNENFFTSDNPVVIHKLDAKGSDILHVNFYKDEFSVFFPLTPYLMVEFYNTETFPESLIMDGTISIVDTEYENQVNKYQYINAEKTIFSYKNDFSLFLKNTTNHE